MAKTKQYTFPATVYRNNEARKVANAAELKEAHKAGWLDDNPWLRNGSKWGEKPEPKEN